VVYPSRVIIHSFVGQVHHLSEKEERKKRRFFSHLFWQRVKEFRAGRDLRVDWAALMA
jgi:hypothetical protein